VTICSLLIPSFLPSFLSSLLPSFPRRRARVTDVGVGHIAENLPLLEHVDLCCTRVTSADALASACPHLTYLDLSNTRVADVRALAQCVNLRKLSLSGCV